MKNKIKISLILFLLLTFIGSTGLLAQSQEENKEKKTCGSQECHSKPKAKGAQDMEEKYTEEQCHKRFAVKLFNSVWQLLGKKDRTQGENDKMIYTAHASLCHWSEVGKAINLQRGQWMVSHVYAVLNHPESALYHAKICMELTEKHKFVDFDLAYAYEGIARAYACSGNKSEAKKFIKLAQEAGEKIEKEKDKKLFLSDLGTGPWYGVK